jgi:UMF1 family MFS transporter
MSIPDRSNLQSDSFYRWRVLAWSWYDWADHAYITTIASTFFPPYFVTIAAPAFMVTDPTVKEETAKAIARSTASNLYAFTVSVSLLVAAFLAPLAGTYADITGQRKRLLIIITLVGGVLASAMFTITTNLWYLGLILYFTTQVVINIALGLNSSLLPHIAHPDDMNRASSLGYAMGYMGGGLSLALCTGLFLFSDHWGISQGLAIRTAFLSVGIWWMIFMIPITRGVPEPPATPLIPGHKGHPFRDTLIRLSHTLHDIRHYRELFKMLIAFWFYMEGIGAIILLATAYGAALGLDTTILISTLLLTQFVAFPYALMYGRIPDPTSKWRGTFVSMLVWTGITFPLMGIYVNRKDSIHIPFTFALMVGNQALGALFSVLVGRHLLAGFTRRLDTKRAVILGLTLYILIPVWGFFLHNPAEFFMLGWLVGTLQGGIQALSRTIYTRLSPRAKSGEFFGLYSLSEKFAGILGPLIYSIVGELTHNPRASVISISIFFLIGIYLLRQVDEIQGAQIAAAEEATIQVTRAAD